MSSALVTELKALLAKFEGEVEPVAEEVKADAEAIGASALSYIKTNGLQDLYGIAKSVLAGIAIGTPWATVLAAVVTQGEAAGIAIAKGAEAVVVAQAQADLIAAGTIASPSTGVTVA